MWASVADYPNYEVSNTGEVRNPGTGRILSLSESDDGYLRASLSQGGKLACRAVHILVARSFIQNPEGKPFVNHIDGDRQNNAAENLEWVTPKENSNKKRHPNYGQNGRKIVQLSANGAFVRSWSSAKHAEGVLRISRSSIGKCCRGNLKTAGGWKWVYQDEHDGDLPDEIWKTIEGKGTLRAVSSLGRVKTSSGRLVFGSPVGGYLMAGGYQVHRAVAETFCDGKEGRTIVNHIDHDKYNNRIENLEWVTPGENVKAAYLAGARKASNHKLRRMVQRKSETGATMMFVSLSEASKFMGGLPIGNISEACQGKRKKAGGYCWSYVPMREDFEMIHFLDRAYAEKCEEDAIDPEMEAYIDGLLT